MEHSCRFFLPSLSLLFFRFCRSHFYIRVCRFYSFILFWFYRLEIKFTSEPAKVMQSVLIWQPNRFTSDIFGHVSPIQCRSQLCQSSTMRTAVDDGRPQLHREMIHSFFSRAHILVGKSPSFFNTRRFLGIAFLATSVLRMGIMISFTIGRHISVSCASLSSRGKSNSVEVNLVRSRGSEGDGAILSQLSVATRLTHF